MADGDTLWFKRLFFTKPFAVWFLKRFLPPPDRRWTFAQWTSLARCISAATRLASYPPFSTQSGSGERAVGVGMALLAFFWSRESQLLLQCPSASKYGVVMGRSADLGSCSYWMFPGDETLGSQQPSALRITEFIHCLQMAGAYPESPRSKNSHPNPGRQAFA